MNSLKKQTVNGIGWSFFERIAAQFSNFVISIILARILSPEDYGIIGMITIFISLSKVFIQSGFYQALIRKKDCTEDDYSTVLYFNLAISVVFYIILYLSAKQISIFYNKEILIPLIKVFGLTLIINSLTTVQRSKIAISVNFKRLTKISLISSFTSGTIGVLLAVFGFGVWSLVYRQLSLNLLETFLFWHWDTWRPKLVFSKSSFNEMFRFGGNLMVMGVIIAIHKNIYNLIIGKYYSASNLGLYTRANALSTLFSETLGQSIDRVTYPVLSAIKNDTNYIIVFEKILRSTMLISFTLLVGLAAISKEFIIVLLGEDWKVAGDYMQILCFVVIFYPLEKLLISTLLVAGRSDSILHTGIIEKILTIPLVIVVIFLGIEPMLYLTILQKVIYITLLNKKAKEYIKITTKELIIKLFPAFISSMIMFLIMNAIVFFLTLTPILALIVKLTTGLIFIFSLFELTRFKDYLYLKKEAITIVRTLRLR